MFQSVDAPTLALGSRVDLEFRAAGLRALRTIGSVTARAEGEGWRRYIFQCELTRRVFLNLLNRRNLSRARLGPRVLARIEILDVADPAPRATLRDLSETGLAIEVDPEVEERVFEREHLDLAVRLAHDAEVLCLRTAIRHRRLVDGRVQYGLALVLDGDRGAIRFAEYVQALLMRE